MPCVLILVAILRRLVLYNLQTVHHWESVLRGRSKALTTVTLVLVRMHITVTTGSRFKVLGRNYFIGFYSREAHDSSKQDLPSYVHLLFAPSGYLA